MTNSEEKSLWERILSGDLDIDHPEVLVMEERSEEFANRVNELRQARGVLREAEQEMRVVLEKAHQETTTEEDLALLNRIPGVEPPQLQAPTASAFSKWLPLAAAVFLAVLGTVWFQSQDNDDPGPALGNENAAVPAQPIGPSIDFDRFVWSGDLRIGSWFVVHVVDSDSGTEVKSPKLTITEWTPTPPIPANFKNIEWYVVLHDESAGLPVSSSPVAASRSQQ